MRIGPIMAVLALAPSGLAAQVTDPSPAIRERLEAFQTAWNAHDAAAIVGLFATDADQVMADGPLIRGRSALQQWWRERFAGMPKGTAIALTVDDIRVVAPGIALMNVHAGVSGGPPAAGQMGSNQDRGTWVLVNQGGQWMISALRVQQSEGPPGR